MKLSEAIRLGSMMKPQGNGGWFGDTSCALLAASEAAGVPCVYSGQYGRLGLDYDGMREKFPILKQHAIHPIYRKPYVLSDTIWYLNDVCSWTRERIADWVETIETQQSVLQAVETGVVR